jgi:hypothetical protein
MEFTENFGEAGLSTLLRQLRPLAISDVITLNVAPNFRMDSMQTIHKRTP